MRSAGPLAVAWLAVAALAPAAASGATESPRVETLEPRAFGYTIGDTLERRIVLILPSAAILPETALPKPGRNANGIELRDIGVTRTDVEGGVRHDIRLRYQIFAAPVQVREIALPALRLRPTGAERPIEVPGYGVFVAPLVAEPFVAGGALGALSPDVAPPLIDTAAARLRLALFAGAALLLGGYLLWRRFGDLLFARRRGPFARAWRDLKGLGDDDASHRAGLRRLHRAFDETAGARVFAEQVEAFLARHPRFVGERAAITAFFGHSRQLFFAGMKPAAPLDTAALRDLCRRCRRIERRQR